MADPNTPVKKEDIRPVTTGGTQVLSGPLPAGALHGIAPIAPGQLVFSGTAGGPFNIRGARFDQIGSVTVNGKPVTVTRWEHNLIKGILPADVEPGEVVVTDGTGKVQKGEFAPTAASGASVTVACPLCHGSGKVETTTK